MFVVHRIYVWSLFSLCLLSEKDSDNYSVHSHSCSVNTYYHVISNLVMVFVL